MVAGIALPAAATVALVSGTLVANNEPAPEAAVVRAAEVDREKQASRSDDREDASVDTVATAREDAVKQLKEKNPSKSEVASGAVKVEPPKPKATKPAESGKAGDSAKASEAGEASDATEGSNSADTAAPSGKACKVSGSIESSLTANARDVYRAVCAQFPEVKSYGGRRYSSVVGNASDHYTGKALDIMITGSTGDRIADYVIDNASELNVKYIIWEQRIWYPGKGWSGMSDRGSATQNHFDHVHVSVE